MEIDKEFKEALSHLPAKEKDKLVLRLLRKDKVLAERLFFELVSGLSAEDRRKELEKAILKKIPVITSRFHSPGYLMADIKYLSGDITFHLKVTKDKYGEIELNLLVLSEILKLTNEKIAKTSFDNAYKFCMYCIKKVYSLLVLIKHFDEDYQADFHKQLEKIGLLFTDNPHLMKLSINNGLDVNWLTQADIPDDIKKEQQRLKSLGFLK